jgi:tryptophan 2,3-dioxygenase
MSGVRKVYWRGGTADADGKPHAAETEFERKFGADIAAWLTWHEKHSLVHYWEALCARGDLSTLRQSEQANELISLLQRYEAAQKLFHGAHIALAVRQLAIVGVEIGTGGSSFKDYLQKYGREHAPLFEGLPEAG